MRSLQARRVRVKKTSISVMRTNFPFDEQVYSSSRRIAILPNYTFDLLLPKVTRALLNRASTPNLQPAMSTTPSNGPLASRVSNEVTVLTADVGVEFDGADMEQGLGQGAEQGVLVELSEARSSAEQKTRQSRTFSNRSGRSGRSDDSPLPAIPGNRVLSNDGVESAEAASLGRASFMHSPSMSGDGAEYSESVDGKLTFNAHSCVPTPTHRSHFACTLWSAIVVCCSKCARQM